MKHKAKTETKTKKKFSSVAALIISLFLALLIAGTGCLATAIFLNAAPSAPPRDADGVNTDSIGGAVVEVRRGESAASVGARLASAGIIKSALFWQVLCRIQNEFIKAGVYRIEMPLPASSIYALLVRGEQIFISVTIPEGSTIKKTAAIWEEAGVCSANDFIDAARSAALLDLYKIPVNLRLNSPQKGAAVNSLEGYLFPDTYFVPPVYPAEKAVMFMADTFFKKLKEAEIDYAALTPEELYRKITLASMVEREYRDADEAPLIAGVFLNRLDIGMRLESCATVEYIITEIQGRPHPRRIWDSDTKIENPYNTYYNAGLPPGPICSPGIPALKAAFYPRSSPFLFFRLVDTRAGKHYFSRTFDDHIKAAALLVKG
ncbi:MAG: endolytic transglycosylase MltG [Spirochaetaceae bacterium]|jgi:UPF0755 protein|nr:endolytic transglycosylase MltG [Spirochaetaceae bacterium]